MTKNETRQIMTRRLLLQDEESVKSSSAIIQKKIMKEIENYDEIFCYVPLKHEVDTTDIIKESISSGKKVYAPVVKGTHMEAAQIKNILDLKPGALGILEPHSGVFSTSFDAILVPGIAFDKECGRLGRGKGNFDRFLSMSTGKKIGIAFDFQIVESVYAQSHDIFMDEVITEKRLIKK